MRVFEKAVADAHPNGAKPWTWPDYVEKFDSLAGAMIEPAERERFIGLVQRFGELAPEEICALNPALPDGRLPQEPSGKGLFDWVGS